MGRRFGGPKQLAAVGPDGEAVLDYSLADAAAAGFRRAVIVVRTEIESAVADHLATRRPTSIGVSLARQDDDEWTRRAGARPKPLGTAHAVLVAMAVVGGDVAVANADDLYGP